MNQPVSVSPREILRVQDLLVQSGPAELIAESIAHALGSPVTSTVIERMMATEPLLFTRRPEAIAKMIISAKEQSNIVEQYTLKLEGERRYGDSQ